MDCNHHQKMEVKTAGYEYNEFGTDAGNHRDIWRIYLSYAGSAHTDEWGWKKQLEAAGMDVFFNGVSLFL